jgi:hypothetical protein
MILESHNDGPQPIRSHPKRLYEWVKQGMIAT